MALCAPSAYFGCGTWTKPPAWIDAELTQGGIGVTQGKRHNLGVDWRAAGDFQEFLPLISVNTQLSEMLEK